MKNNTADDEFVLESYDADYDPFAEEANTYDEGFWEPDPADESMEIAPKEKKELLHEVYKTCGTVDEFIKRAKKEINS